MGDAPGELQKAIYAALSAALSVSVYDGAPQNASMPYVDLGEAQEVDWGTKTNVGSEHYITMHVWSSSQSKGEAWGILNTIKNTLHEQSLAVTGQNLVLMRHQDTQVFRDADGVTIHGIARYRMLTDE